MLEIQAIMNSTVEDVFNFKTCCGLRIFDQNLELLVKNRGTQPIEVTPFFDLLGTFGSCRIDTLIPPASQLLMAGEAKAFYCTMDEETWRDSRILIFYDKEGHDYVIPVHSGND